MIFSLICVQINTMFTKKEFKVAAVIALFYSCFAFAFTLTEFSGIDISKIKDANQLVCFSQSNRLWFFFSLLYPFLLVLPFSTSYIDDYKNQLLPVYISRTSRTIYYVSKLVASFFGTFLIIAVPFFINLILCNVFLPHNQNTWLGEYQMGNYFRQLLGTNILYQTSYTKMPFLKIFLYSPFLYNFIYLLIFAAFSGLLASFTLSLSFLYKKSKLFLFIPVFATLQLFRVYDSDLFSRSIEGGQTYVNFDILDYVVPTLLKGQDYAFFAKLVFIIFLAIVTLCIYGIKSDLKSLQ